MLCHLTSVTTRHRTNFEKSRKFVFRKINTAAYKWPFDRLMAGRGQKKIKDKTSKCKDAVDCRAALPPSQNAMAGKRNDGKSPCRRPLNGEILHPDEIAKKDLRFEI